MSLLWRYVVSSCVIVAAVMAWWYPEPVLVRGELVDWGRLYERRNAPPEHMLGAMALGKALIQSVSEPLPLTEFIAGNTAGRTVEARDPAWQDVFSSLDASMDAGSAPVRFSRPAEAPFAELDKNLRYVEFRDGKGIRHMEYRFIPAREFESVDIPEDKAFPARPYWMVMLLGSVGAVGLGLAGGRAANLVEGSSASRGVRWSAVFGVLFSGMILWPFVHGTVGSGLSFASILMGGLFLIGALVGLWLFGSQVRQLRDMVEGGRHLAHFVYDPAEWKAFAEWNYGQESSQKRAMWLIIFAISVVVGGGLMAVKRDEASVVVFAGLMGFMAVLWLLAVGLPWLTRRRDLRGPGEVYVGERCVYLNGTVHSWGKLASRLDSVKLDRKPIPHILLVYSYMMVAGRSLYFFRNYVEVRIPVPRGQEDAGAAVVKALEKSAHVG
jgi:hypothetical protein